MPPSVAGDEGADPMTAFRLVGWRTSTGAIFPGLLVSGTIALAATWLAQHYNAPVMLFALLLGMAFHFLHEEGRCPAGIEFGSKSLLRIGVRRALPSASFTSFGPIVGTWSKAILPILFSL